MLDAGAGYSPQDPLSFHTSLGSYVTALKAFERRLRNGPEFVIFKNLLIRLVPLSFQRTQSV